MWKKVESTNEDLGERLFNFPVFISDEVQEMATSEVIIWDFLWMAFSAGQKKKAWTFDYQLYVGGKKITAVLHCCNCNIFIMTKEENDYLEEVV